MSETKRKAKRVQAARKVSHPIQPLYDEHSEILILGSFPSVKSREAVFFYGHLQNRFWKVTAAVFGEKVLPMSRGALSS